LKHSSVVIEIKALLKYLYTFCICIIQEITRSWTWSEAVTGHVQNCTKGYTWKGSGLDFEMFPYCVDKLHGEHYTVKCFVIFNKICLATHNLYSVMCHLHFQAGCQIWCKSLKNCKQYRLSMH